MGEWRWDPQELLEADAALFEGEWFKTGDLLRRDEVCFHWFVGRTRDIIRRLSPHQAGPIRLCGESFNCAAFPVSITLSGIPSLVNSFQKSLNCRE